MSSTLDLLPSRRIGLLNPQIFDDKDVKLIAETDQPDYGKTRNYWNWLKNKLKKEGSELVSHTNQLKMPARDGKSRLTDLADTEQVLRLIQSIPSRKAEPFKMWLAQPDSPKARLRRLGSGEGFL